MNAEKLTLEMCFKYPKAKIERINEKSVGDVYYDNIFEMIYKRGDFDSRTNTSTLQDIFEDYTLCEYQLILRPLSSLTDEERKPITTLKESDALFKNINTLLCYIHGENLIRAVDYLRSISIDIDNLQESGIATYE